MSSPRLHSSKPYTTPSHHKPATLFSKRNKHPHFKKKKTATTSRECICCTVPNELGTMGCNRGITIYKQKRNCHSTSGVSSHASGISLSGTVASDNADQHSSFPMHRFQIVEQLSITVCQGMIVNLWSFRVANYSYGTSGI